MAAIAAKTGPLLYLWQASALGNTTYNRYERKPVSVNLNQKVPVLSGSAQDSNPVLR